MENTKTISSIGRTLFISVLFLSLVACYGPRVNRKNAKIESKIFPTIATANDASINATLNKIMVRNLPGSWAKDAKWDEYIFHIENLSSQPITINKVTIKGGLNEKHQALTTRKDLNEATKSTIRNYKSAGIKIKLGAGSSQVLLKSITGTAIGTGVGAGVASTGAISTGAGTLTTAGGAVVVAVPALAIGGVMKVVNNRKINKQIKKRHTTLPLTLAASQVEVVDLFYSAVPGPKSVEIWYSESGNNQVIKLDLGERFNKLHYKVSKK